MRSVIQQRVMGVADLGVMNRVLAVKKVMESCDEIRSVLGIGPDFKASFSVVNKAHLETVLTDLIILLNEVGVGENVDLCPELRQHLTLRVLKRLA